MDASLGNDGVLILSAWLEGNSYLVQDNESADAV